MRKVITLLFVLLFAGLCLSAETINLTGKISDQSGKPIKGVIVKLVGHGLKDTTDAQGSYRIISGDVAIRSHLVPYKEDIVLENGILRLGLTSTAPVKVEVFDIQGNLLLNESMRKASPGLYRFNIRGHINATNMMVIRASIGSRVSTYRYTPIQNNFSLQSTVHKQGNSESHLAKTFANVDQLTVTADRYTDKTVEVTSYEGTLDVSLDTLVYNLDKFSFFLTSLEGLQELSGSEFGFGGDLRFGETGPGAGLRGADKICESLAEMSMPGSKVKKWRAFLSAEKGVDGTIVNAVERIGVGPWFDRKGRLFANNISELLNDRPENADANIINDFPNELGIPNSRPDPTIDEQVDNHLTITGSNRQGLLYNHERDAADEGFFGGGGFSKTSFGGFDTSGGFGGMGMSMGGEYPEKPTCEDWTSTTRESSPRAGFSWPQSMSSMGGGFGGFDTTGGSFSKRQFGMTMGSNWLSAWSMSGCEAGYDLAFETGAGQTDVYTIGNGGGYGGYYCFALNP